jgi:hypothetical protein
MSLSITEVSVLKHGVGKVISLTFTPLPTAPALHSEKCQENKSIGRNEYVSADEIKLTQYK